MKYCDVHTLLNETKANVCANMVAGRSCLAKANGMTSPERSSCGKNGIEANGVEEWPMGEEVRCRRVLYGEKLCRWSTRERWWR